MPSCCRNGEVSQAMRNRGIELYILPESQEAGVQGQLILTAAAQDRASGLKAIIPQLDTCSDDERVAGALGLPGTVLPRAMAAAHAQLVALSSASHRCGERRFDWLIRSFGSYNTPAEVMTWLVSGHHDNFARNAASLVVDISSE